MNIRSNICAIGLVVSGDKWNVNNKLLALLMAELVIRAELCAYFMELLKSCIFEFNTIKT